MMEKPLEYLTVAGNGIRNTGGYVCILVEAFHYEGQEKRYEEEVEERNRYANVLAAAPDMLEALKAIVDFCDDPNGSEKGESLALGMSRLLPAARAAILKAEAKP
jgi:hypothetical protein